VKGAKIAVPFGASSPDSEVPAKPQRRSLSAEEKKRILEDPITPWQIAVVSAPF
jgi:hypothetical protein